jgi:hypothetical protein
LRKETVRNLCDKELFELHGLRRLLALSFCDRIKVLLKTSQWTKIFNTGYTLYLDKNPSSQITFVNTLLGNQSVVLSENKKILKRLSGIQVQRDENNMNSKKPEYIKFKRKQT